MKIRSSASFLICAAVLLGTARTAHAAFTAVDNFNSRTPGDINTQGGWVANNATTAQVIVDPGNPINKILHHTGTGDAGISLPATIANSSTGTYFFRIKRVSATSDDSFGLAQAAPTTATVADVANFKVQPSILNTALRGRDVASEQNVVPTMATTAWYKVWLVVNNVAGSGTSGTTGDNYKIFIQSGDDTTFAAQTEYLPSDGVWNFRQGTLQALLTAQLTSNSATTSVYYDDLYIDNSGQNLTDPSAPVDVDGDFLNDAWEIFYFGSIATQNGSDGAINGDKDGLTNEREETLGTNPTIPDTDGDTLSDGNEADGISNAFAGGLGTNPVVADTDGDGLNDLQENGSLNGAFGNQPTNPNSADTDNDSFSDHLEVVRYGTNPNDSASAPVWLISPTLRNGGFDLLGTPPGAVNPAKAEHWDSDPDGDVTYWTVWAGESSAEGNSGTEGNPKHAYLQNGSATYNITDQLVQQGDVVFFNFDNAGGAVPIRGGLVYNSGTDLAPVINRFPVSAQPATEISADTNGTNRQLLYTIPAGSPAIGKKIGVGFTSFASWSQADNVTLTVTVADADSDHDGLADGWEVFHFGNTAQTATGDFENDGTDNLTEFRLNLNPKGGASRFAAATTGMGALTWPSVTGVTFRIQRSTDLLNWTTLQATFAGTVGTASYTDGAAPVGKAYYRVGLNP